MPTKKPWNCDEKHADLADVLTPLLESQAKKTGGRHRCAGCAYQEGILEGLRRARVSLGRIEKSIKPARTFTGPRKLRA